MKRVVLFLCILLLFVPVLAIGNEDPDPGIVPCGPGSEELNDERVDCEPCHLLIMFDVLVYSFLIGMIVPVAATLLFVVGGIFYLFSAGDPGKLDQGKKIITSTIVGIFIIYTAHLAISTIYGEGDMLDIVTGELENWDKIGFEECELPDEWQEEWDYYLQ